MKKILKNYSFSFILIISILFGSLIGIIFKENACVLKPFGTIFLNLLYVIVIPLVFFTISSSISNIKNYKKLGKIFYSMFIVFVITSIIASLFMLLGIKIFDPIGSISIKLVEGVKEKIDLGSKFVQMITANDFYELFSKNKMFALIIASIIFGLGVNLTKETDNLKKELRVLSNVMLKIINLIMYYAPIGLCCYFAALVGEYGNEIIGSYAKSMLFYYLIAIIYFIVFNMIYTYISDGKNGCEKFFNSILTPLVTSFGTCSSLASLPTNMRCADELDIDDDVKNTVLPIGSTMHMEGSSMASILKIAFLFSVFGKSFTGLSTILIAIIIAVLSGVVMSGIPGGGLIGEMLIVSIYGFPLEAFPIIATIGWIIDPPATALNVTGDISSSMLVNKLIDK